jgi:hypothetical protein
MNLPNVTQLSNCLAQLTTITSKLPLIDQQKECEMGPASAVKTNHSLLSSQKSVVTCCSGFGWEWNYQLDEYYVTKGGYIQHLGGTLKNLGEFIFPSAGLRLQSF